MKQASIITLFVCTLCGVSVTEAQTNGLMWLTSDTVLSDDHVGSIVIGADGITLDCDNHLVISDNPGNTTGIVVDSRSGVTVQNCHAIDHNRGFFSLLSTDVSFRFNTVVGSTWAGFDLGLTVGGELIENLAADNHYGIVLSRSSDILLRGNTATHNVEAGLASGQSADCLLVNNNVDENAHFGILLSSSSGFNVIHNEACGNGNADARVVDGSDNRFQANHFCVTSGF